MSIILSFIALILFAFVGIIDSFFNLVYKVRGRKWYKLTNGRNFKKSLNIDVFGNYQYVDLWNFLFSKGGYEFGKFGETMSSCFGKKQLEKTLSWFGWVVLIIINIIDYTKWIQGLKGKGFHCNAAIQPEEEIKKFITH